MPSALEEVFAEDESPLIYDEAEGEALYDNPELEASAGLRFDVGAFPQVGTPSFWVGLIVILAIAYVMGVRIGFRGVVFP